MPRNQPSKPARKKREYSHLGVGYPRTMYRVPFTRTTTYYTAGGEQTGTTTDTVYNDVYPQKADKRNGEWYDGWLRPTDYYANFLHMGAPSGRYEYRKNDLSGYIDFNLMPIGITPGWAGYWDPQGAPTRFFNKQNRCETECIVKLIAGGAQLGAALAESRKTLSMISGNVIRFFAAYKAAKRGQWKKAAAALGIPTHSFKNGSKDISGRWLELQYGWLPLLGDITSTVEKLKGYSTATWKPLCVTRTLDEVINEEKTIVTPGYVNLWRTKGTHSVRVQLWYNVTDPRLHLLANLGLVNPLSVGWELVPFSFVLDWFLPVGTFLEAWTATLGCNFLSGTVTTKAFGQERNYTYWDESGSDYTSTGDTLQTNIVRGFHRMKYDTWPNPSLYLKSPLTKGHMLNALALINQRWK